MSDIIDFTSKPEAPRTPDESTERLDDPQNDHDSREQRSNKQREIYSGRPTDSTASSLAVEHQNEKKYNSAVSSEDYPTEDKPETYELESIRNINTLKEPISETIKRDLMRIYNKIRLVLKPYKANSNVNIKDWDLWGPFLLCIFLARYQYFI